ncbi:30S ribosomal protein S5 [archaeon]|jgi:small subunit ribosomal protein S5|nr:30S ribosomal protein S5 [archaeon]
MTEEKINKEAIEESKEVVEEKVETPEEVVEETQEEVKEEPKKENPRDRKRRSFEPTREEIVAAWTPKTKLGQQTKDGKIKSIDEILDNNQKILESQIVDALVNLKSDLISIGQAKGKFGGGKRRAWRQTQRKTREGNVPTFSTLAVIGDENGHIGIGGGKAMETLPARDKAIRKAKINIQKITRDCAGFDCSCDDAHTVPFEVTGKCGSVRVTLIPAAQGTGLVVANELKKVLKLAGIKDVHSKVFGRSRTTFNLVKACIAALEKTNARNKK